MMLLVILLLFLVLNHTGNGKPTTHLTHISLCSSHSQIVHGDRPHLPQKENNELAARCPDHLTLLG